MCFIIFRFPHLLLKSRFFSGADPAFYTAGTEPGDARLRKRCFACLSGSTEGTRRRAGEHERLWSDMSLLSGQQNKHAEKRKKNAPGVFIRMRIRYNAGGQKEGIRFLKHGSGGTLNVCRGKTVFRKQQTSGDGPEEDFLKNGAGSRHRIPAEKAERMRTVCGERKQ